MKSFAVAAMVGSIALCGCDYATKDQVAGLEKRVAVLEQAKPPASAQFLQPTQAGVDIATLPPDQRIYTGFLEYRCRNPFSAGIAGIDVPAFAAEGPQVAGAAPEKRIGTTELTIATVKSSNGIAVRVRQGGHVKCKVRLEGDLNPVS